MTRIFAPAARSQDFCQNVVSLGCFRTSRLLSLLPDPDPMNKSQQTGHIGEMLAREHIQTLGYEVLAYGYRYRRAEIDLIALQDKCLVFIEVKTRRGMAHGHPSLAVSSRKEQHIARAAQAFMRQIDHDWEIRFDIISILLHPDNTHTLEHQTDAFFPGMW